MAVRELRFLPNASVEVGIRDERDRRQHDITVHGRASCRHSVMRSIHLPDGVFDIDPPCREIEDIGSDGAGVEALGRPPIEIAPQHRVVVKLTTGMDGFQKQGRQLPGASYRVATRLARNDTLE